MAESSEIQQLRELLLAPEVSARIDLERDLDAIRHQIRDPEQLSKLLAPVVADVVRRGDPALSLAILRAITPLIDRALREKAEQDTAAISSALAPASTGSIALHYASAPKAAAQDLAPLMSAAIEEEIRGERDAMIDALYPVIGSTISKYLSETLATLVRTINERIESHLSLRSLGRKLRSRITGVSEAELLLRESLPLNVEAVFLIHKSSGLVVAQAQNPDSPPLDPDLLSGMLTAIRSLFNESMNTPGPARELDQIEYGESKIILEVAGYCYLAAVVRGIPDEAFRQTVRTTMASIVQMHGDAIAEYSGSPASVPGSLTRGIQELVQPSKAPLEVRRAHKPYAVLTLGCLLLLLACIPLIIHIHRNSIDRDTEARTIAAFLSVRPSLFNGIAVKADRGNVQLSGNVPNDFLRARAEEIARIASPGMTIENRITADAAPPFPLLTGLRTNEIVAALNTIDGIFLESRYQAGDLAITGTVADSSLADKVARTFQALPGVRSFDSRVNVGAHEIARRLLFDMNSVKIRPMDNAVLWALKDILGRTPWSKLLITGHSDEVGGEDVNRRIAMGRAIAAQTALRRLGVTTERLLIEGKPGPPPGNTAVGPDSLSRCARFRLLSKTSAKPE